MIPAVVIIDGDAEYDIYFGTPAHYAAMEWARFHGLDPNRIPTPSVIIRDAPGRRLICDEYVKNGPEVGDIVIVDGEPRIVRRIEQGEAPPLRLPVEVTG